MQRDFDKWIQVMFKNRNIDSKEIDLNQEIEQVLF